MKIAIVTGASSGLGHEFVKELDHTERLDEIWVVARRKDRLESLQKSVAVHLRIFALDLTEPRSLEKISSVLALEKPEVRILVNAAGFGKMGSWKDISLSDCDRMIELNCRAAVDMTQISLPYLSAGGRILEICSTAAFQPFPYLNLYAATKAFLYRYSRALRAELLGTGIRVTAVCPYWIKDTEFIGTARKGGNSACIRSFPFASHQVHVAKRALLDSRLGFAVSTPGPICSVHRLAAKVIPDTLLMGIWALLRRI